MLLKSTIKNLFLLLIVSVFISCNSNNSSSRYNDCLDRNYSDYEDDKIIECACSFYDEGISFDEAYENCEEAKYDSQIR